MRSKWKSFYSVSQVSDTVLKIWDRSLVITMSYLNKRVLVYSGLRFVSILIREIMVGHKFGEFVVTKSLGGKIHTKKKKKR
jgi:small subunit ribosomal protein S19